LLWRHGGEIAKGIGNSSSFAGRDACEIKTEGAKMRLPHDDLSTRVEYSTGRVLSRSLEAFPASNAKLKADVAATVARYEKWIAQATSR